MANFKFVKSATAAVLGASVLTTAVVVPGADASAKTTYKVNKYGYLVNAKTNKKVNGYKTYKGKLYKNGKKFTGKTSYGTYYVKGKKFTGKTKYGYYYVNGKRFTGTTKYGYYYVNGKRFNGKTKYGNLYVNGKRYTGTTKYGYTYYNGKRVEGEYKGKVYANGKKYTGVYKDKLYKNGVLNVGLYLHNGKLYEDAGLNEGKDLYKEVLYDGATPNKGLALYEGKLYNDSALATGYVTFDEKLYNEGSLFTGEKDGVEYKDGVVVKYEVTSVKAINAEELQVTFSEAVDATALDETNYELTLNGNKTRLSTSNADVKLDDAATTATIRLKTPLPTFKSGDKISLQVSDGVKTKKSKSIERYASETFAFEAVAPKLISAKVGPTSTVATLTFDQPIVEANSNTLVKIDGYSVATGSTGVFTLVGSKTPGNYTYTVSLSSLTAAQLKEIRTVGQHNIALFDVANTTASTSNPAVAPVINGTYTVSNVESAPKVQSVTAINSNKFFVAFDQTIKNNAFKVQVSKGTLTFPEATSTEYAGISSNGVLSNSKVWVSGLDSYNGVTGYYVVVSDTFANDPNPLYKDLEKTSDVTLKISEFQSESGLLGDVYNNNLKLSKDANKPVVDTKALTASALTLDFDQAVDTLDTSKVIVKDKDGVVLKQGSGTGGKYTPSLTDSDTLTITAENGYSFSSAEPYTVELAAGAVKYTVNKSSIAGYSLVANKNDAISEKVGTAADVNTKYYALQNLSNVVTTPSTNTILVNYGTKMDKDTALNAANYKLDGQALTNATLNFYEDTKQVLITFKDETFKANGNYRLSISKDVLTEAKQQVVKDAQSKDEYVGLFTSTDNVAPKLTGAKYLVTDTDYNKVNSTNRIQLTFSEAVNLSTDFVSGTSGPKVSDDDVKITIKGQTFSGKLSTTSDANVLVFTLDNGKTVNVSEAGTITLLGEDDQVDTKAGIKDGNSNKAASSTASLTEKVLDQDTIANNVLADNTFKGTTVASFSGADVTGSGNDGKVKLDWTALSNATSYTITYTVGTETKTKTVTTNTATIDGLTNGTAYTFSIKANNGRVDTTAAATTTATPAAYVAATAGKATVATAYANDAAVAAGSFASKVITVTVDGGAAQTVTFTAAAVTQQKVLDEINAVLNTTATATFDSNGKLVITSASTGASSSVAIAGVDAATLFGAITPTAGTAAAN